MAEKKVHNIVAAEPDKENEGKVVHQARPVGNASGLRIGAIILFSMASAPFSNSITQL